MRPRINNGELTAWERVTLLLAFVLVLYGSYIGAVQS